MKGILLAGGSGTRLYPMTSVFSKHLYPIYNKPMIYYPLSTLMLLGIKEVVFITTTRDLPFYQELFGDGSRLGIKLIYEIQDKPNGIAEAVIMSEKHFHGHKVCLILGDNIFYIPRMNVFFEKPLKLEQGAYIFGMHVKDPERFGIATIDESGKVIDLEEKPKNPKSDLAVPGLYFYDEHCFDYVKEVKPSARGELEITALNEIYLRKNQLYLEQFNRSCMWLDSGTPDSLAEASGFIKNIESMQDVKIACIEEVAVNMNYITKDDLKKWLENNGGSSDYIKYIRKLVS